MNMAPNVPNGCGDESHAAVQLPPPAAGGRGADGDAAAADAAEAQPHAPIPNSKPRETYPDEDTYVYRDFAKVPAPGLAVTSLHPQSLQAQKLPAKLASILSDQGTCRSVSSRRPRRDAS